MGIRLVDLAGQGVAVARQSVYIDGTHPHLCRSAGAMPS
jgi:hypothetical protein